MMYDGSWLWERGGEKEKGMVISQKGSKEQDMMAWPGREAGRLFWVNLRRGGGWNI